MLTGAYLALSESDLHSKLKSTELRLLLGLSAIDFLAPSIYLHTFLTVDACNFHGSCLRCET